MQRDGLTPFRFASFFIRHSPEKTAELLKLNHGRVSLEAFDLLLAALPPALRKRVRARTQHVATVYATSYASRTQDARRVPTDAILMPHAVERGRADAQHLLLTLPRRNHAALAQLPGLSPDHIHTVTAL